jgi:uncharacterized protein
VRSRSVPEHEPGPLDSGGGPRPAHERIEVIDAVRGLALLGILVVNAPLFFWPVHGVPLGLPEVVTPLDAAARALTTYVFEGKFFTVFSLLFGIGIAMQLERGHPPGRIRRRLVLLGLFGALHVSLFWWGDILLHYAILGGVLLLTREWSPRRLVRAAVLLAAVPLALGLAFGGLTELAAATPEGRAVVERTTAETVASFRRDADAATATYSSTDMAAMVARRWSDWGFATFGTLFNGMLLLVVAMFLLGAAAQRSGWARLEAADRWRWLFLRALPVALVANALYAVASLQAGAAFGGWPALLATFGFVVGAPSGALAIATGAALLLRAGGPVATAFAATGRLALSTYLTQSLVMTTLAYGYGAGLYGSLGAAAAFALALALFALQVPLAVAWARRFPFGPMEWLWRTLTYGRRPA